MKILDRYILKSFLITFTSVFLILMLIFILQTIWLYISELAGKDLDIVVVLKFIFYFMPKLIPLVLPLSILLASIMTFGSFAENYEFAAMKSGGISLQRAMRSLIVFIFLLSIATFYFANNLIPWSEFKSYNLRQNIARVKPAMVIVEGQFNQVGDMNIKIDEKYGDYDQYLKNVVIHKRLEGQNGNYTTILAKKGELIGSEDSNILQLVLQDGNYYDDVQTKDYKRKRLMPHAKSSFEKYTINIDLSGLNDVDMGKEDYSNTYKMLKVNTLKKSIDSISVAFNQEKNFYTGNLLSRSGFEQIKDFQYKKRSSTSEKSKNLMLSLKTTQNKIDVLDLALTNVTANKGSLEAKKIERKFKQKTLNKFELELHKKFAIAFACIVLFFVGAPLGAIIRKGGLGLPMVIAICLFITFHFVGIFGENSSEEDGISPWLGAWIPSIIMFPLGVLLTKRATSDKGLFSMDNFIEGIKIFFKKLISFQKKISDKSKS